MGSRIHVSRALVDIEDPQEFRSALESNLRDLIDQLNSQTVTYTRLGSNSPYPLAPNPNDILYDYSTGSLRVAVFDGVQWIYFDFGSFTGSITENQHGALGRVTTGGNALHTVATTSQAGFESTSDKTKLDGIATGATNTPLSASTPATVTVAGAGSAGSSTSASKADHAHPVTALDDTTHGARGGGTLHADATTSVAGFLSSADKTKINYFLGRTSSASAPTTTEYPVSQNYGFHYNSTGPIRYFAWNDAGTVYSVQLT